MDPIAAGYFLHVVFLPAVQNHAPEKKEPRIPAGLEQAIRPAPVAFMEAMALDYFLT